MGVRIFDMELFFNEAVEATEQRCSPKKSTYGRKRSGVKNHRYYQLY